MTQRKIILPSNKSFGLLFSIIFIILGIYCLLNAIPFYVVFFLISVIFFTVALLKPSYLHYLNKSWMFLGYLLNMITSPIILGSIYFFLITPTGIIRRYIFKSDELSLKKNDVDTYWVISKKDSNNADTFKRQF